MRARTLLTAVVLIGSIAAVGQQPAQAVPQGVTATCTLSIAAKLVVRAPDSKADARFGSDCPSNAVRATWYARPGWVTLAMEKGTLIRVPLEYTEIGKPTTWVGDSRGALAPGGTKVADLPPVYTMTKCASAARLSGVRQGNKTTLTATASYYNLKAKTFVRWHGRMLLQFQDGRTWKNLAYVTPNAAGVATYALTTNRSRNYRVYIASNTSVWYSYSASIWR